MSSSAADNAFHAITSSLHQDVLQQPLLTNALDSLNGSLDLYPFHMSDSLRNLLNTQGLNVSSFAHQQHAHPANKSLENYFNFEVIPNLVRQPASFLFIKRSKFDRIRNTAPAPNQNYFQRLINTQITGQDLIRYTDTDNRFLAPIPTPIAFMFDVLHYLTPLDITRVFMDSPNLETLYATCVLPPEILGREASKLPELYQLTYLDDSTFAYTPEGHSGGAYIQPVKGVFWLTHNQIHGPVRLKITKLETKCAHHLLQITRLPILVPNYNLFPSYNLIRVPQIYTDTFHLENPYIPYDLFYRSYMYAKSIKNVDERTLYAKIRQLLTTQDFLLVNIQTANFLVDAIIFIISRQWSYNGSAYVSLNLFSSFTNATAGLIKRYTINVLRIHYFNKIMSLLDSRPKDISVPLATFHINGSASHSALYDNEARIQPCGREALQLLANSLLPPHDILDDPDEPDDGPWWTLNGAVACLTRMHLRQRQSTIRQHQQLHSYESNRHYHREFINCPTEPTSSQPLQSTYIPGRPRPRSITLTPSSNTLTSTPTLTPPITADSANPLNHTATINPITTASTTGSTNNSTLLAGTRPQPQKEKQVISTNQNETVPTPFDANNPQAESSNTSSIIGVSAPHDDAPHLTSNANQQYITYLETKRVKPLPMPKQNMCLFIAVAEATKIPIQAIWDRVISPESPKHITGYTENRRGFDLTMVQKIANRLGVSITLRTSNAGWLHYGSNPQHRITLYWRRHHFTATPESNYSYPESNHNNNNDEAIWGGILKPLTISDTLLKITDTYWCNYHANADRAKKYVQDLKNGLTGTLQRRTLPNGIRTLDYVLKIDNRVKHSTAPTCKLAFRAGFAGCGKTSPVANYLLSLVTANELGPLDLTVITPRAKLRAKWVQDTQIKHSFAVKTFESVFYENTAKIVIIDEITLFPPGYLSTLLYINPQISHVLVLGDILQAYFNEPNSDALINDLTPEAVHLSPFITNYSLFTHRLPLCIANAIGVGTSSTEPGFITHSTRLRLEYPVLCPDEASMNRFSQFNYKVFTYNSSQGQDFKTPVTIFINSATNHCSLNSWVTALTRSKCGLYLFDNRSDRQKRNCQPWVTNFLIHTNISDYVANHLHYLVPTNALLYGASPYSTDTQLMLSDNVWLQGLLGHENRVLTPSEQDLLQPIQLETPSLNTSQPVSCESLLNETLIANTLDKYDREQHTASGTTDQFALDPSRVFETVFPRHRLCDEATFRLAIKKRIKVQTALANKAEFRSRQTLGAILFELLQERYKLNPTFITPEMLEKHRFELEDTRLSKPLKQQLNNAKRADPDWALNWIELFMKSQLCKKLEKFQSKAIPGQTLSTFCDAVHYIVGPWIRSLSEVIQQQLSTHYPNVYINHRRNTDDLNEFVQNHWNFSIESSETDYTAFDQSQHAEYLHMQELIMTYFGFPKTVINFYHWLKVHSSCFLGHLNITLFTGEDATFIFNTLTNLVTQPLLYTYPKDCAQVFAGDDSAINAHLHKRSLPSIVTNQLELTAKTAYSKFPTFCGFVFASPSIFKDPFLLAARIKAGFSTKEVEKFYTNFKLEHSFLYNNYESLFHSLSERQIEAHSFNTRFFIKRPSILGLWQMVPDSVFKLI
jgi:hypothetical protein